MPRFNFALSNASLVLFLLTIIIGLDSMRSYVVKRFWQLRHSLLLLVALPSLASLLSITLMSGWLQNGHCMVITPNALLWNKIYKSLFFCFEIFLGFCLIF